VLLHKFFFSVKVEGRESPNPAYGVLGFASHASGCDLAFAEKAIENEVHGKVECFLNYNYLGMAEEDLDAGNVG